MAVVSDGIVRLDCKSRFFNRRDRDRLQPGTVGKGKRPSFSGYPVVHASVTPHSAVLLASETQQAQSGPRIRASPPWELPEPPQSVAVCLHAAVRSYHSRSDRGPSGISQRGSPIRRDPSPSRNEYRALSELTTSISLLNAEVKGNSSMHPRTRSSPVPLSTKGFSANMVTKSVIGWLKIYKSFHSTSSQNVRKKKAATSTNLLNSSKIAYPAKAFTTWRFLFERSESTTELSEIEEVEVFEFGEGRVESCGDGSPVVAILFVRIGRNRIG